MKRILTLALCALAIGSISAQKETVKAAKKLAGKVDKIEEARTLIREALESPETGNDPATFVMAGDIEFKAYDNMKKNASIQGAPEDLLRMDGLLLQGYPYYLKAAQMAPDSKESKDASMKIIAHLNDFFQAGADFFNNKKYYPEAYNAFMIYGDLPAVEAFQGKNAIFIPDSVRATSYYNAGLAGWSADKLVEAAKAFKASRLAGYHEPQAYVYELACWQNILQRDSTMTQQGRQAILDVARAGYDKFGLAQPVFLNNMVNVYVENDQEQEAVKLLDELIAANPVPQLYGLRGYVYDRMDQGNASIADYLKAVSFADCDYETLKNASKKFYRHANEELNNLEISSPTYKMDRERIKGDLENMLKIANRAKNSAPEGANNSDIEYVIDSIEYLLNGLK